MKLSRLEKKVFVDLRNEIAKAYEREQIEDFDEFNEEDVDYRVANINKTISLLIEEKQALLLLNRD
jgi:hypothetical protein